MLRQNKKSCKRIKGSKFPRSLYRGPRGRKCPIGALIPNKEYSKKIEDFGVHHLIVSNSIPSLCGLNPELFHEIQLIHDEIPVRKWKRELSKITNKYRLKMKRIRRKKKKKF